MSCKRLYMQDDLYHLASKTLGNCYIPFCSQIFATKYLLMSLPLHSWVDSGMASVAYSSYRIFSSLTSTHLQIPSP